MPDLDITIVDKIGQTYKPGDMVYAYYDTSLEKYIALEKVQDTTPMIYGLYSPTLNTIKVNYASGSDNIAKNDTIQVVNRMNLNLSGCISNSSSLIPAVAALMEVLP